MNTHVIGVTGEDMAAAYLSKHRYKILQRNYTCSFGEVDIIARHKKYYVFVEVKRRKSDKFGLPREAVTPDKQQKICACATLWMVQNKVYGKPVRFDVVEVMLDKINVIEDAFRYVKPTNFHK